MTLGSGMRGRHTSANQSTGREVVTLPVFLLLLRLSIIALFVLTFLFQPFQIPSESMENTLLHGDFLLANKVSVGAGGLWSWLLPYQAIRRGDIVVFHFSLDPDEYVAKRIIGLPGERVRLSNGEVLIDGAPLSEPYAIRKGISVDVFRDQFPSVPPNSAAVDAAWRADLPKHVRNGEVIVPAGEYFVLGDNRDQSLDSRYWGFVPKENIVARPLFIYWSMDLPERPPFADSAAIGLADFAYAATHVFSLTRWRRVMRRVPTNVAP